MHLNVAVSDEISAVKRVSGSTWSGHGARRTCSAASGLELKRERRYRNSSQPTDYTFILRSQVIASEFRLVKMSKFSLIKRMHAILQCRLHVGGVQIRKNSFCSTLQCVITDPQTHPLTQIFAPYIKQESPADARVARDSSACIYRQLGFLKFQSCTISSAVPENPP